MSIRGKCPAAMYMSTMSLMCQHNNLINTNIISRKLEVGWAYYKFLEFLFQ